MKNMRKTAVLILALCLVFTMALTSCNKGSDEATGTGTNNGATTNNNNNNNNSNGDKLEDFPVEGGKYTGPSVNGAATGIGTIEYDNGNVYDGAVKDGKPEGDGVMIDGVTQGTYTGSFVNGLYSDDDAKLEFDNGGIYEGSFEEGHMKGEGKFTWPDGSVLTGKFLGNCDVKGSAGNLDAEGVIAFVGGINFTGTVAGGFPHEGKFDWPNNGPEYKGEFTAFLTGYGDLDMKNGIIYHGPMGAGLLVPTDAWNALGKKVTINYPENTVYHGEVFEGEYVHNDAEAKDELRGTITKKDGSVIKNVMIKLDWSFAYVAA